MTLTIEPTRSGRAIPVAVTSTTWAVADEGLWIANSGGSFGGTVDQHGAHYFVMDAFGRYIGDFDGLETAQAALVQHLAVRGLLP